MRKMIVQSETDAEDAQAAIHISEATRRKDCDQVIWFSNMGKKLALIDKSVARVDDMKEKLECFGVSISSLSKGLSDLKFTVLSLSAEFQEFKDSIKEQKEKKKPKQTKEE